MLIIIIGLAFLSKFAPNWYVAPSLSKGLVLFISFFFYLVESPLDIIKVFNNKVVIMSMSVFIATFLLLFSGKYPKLRPIALIIAAIVFVASYIVF